MQYVPEKPPTQGTLGMEALTGVRNLGHFTYTLHLLRFFLSKKFTSRKKSKKKYWVFELLDDLVQTSNRLFSDNKIVVDYLRTLDNEIYQEIYQDYVKTLEQPVVMLDLETQVEQLLKYGEFRTTPDLPEELVKEIKNLDFYDWNSHKVVGEQSGVVKFLF